MSQKTNIGIDVSKNSFDVFIHETKEHKYFSMNEKSIKEAISWINQLNPQIVVLEATGGYERQLSSELTAAQIPVSISNPKNIRNFAKAIGVTAKTDKIDAAVIATYAKTIAPKATAILSEQQQKIKQLVCRRKQLVDLRTIEKNHTEHAYFKEISKSISSVVSHLNKQINLIEKELSLLIQADDVVSHKVKILTSASGVGNITAISIIAELPELGTLNRRQIASLTGLAPMNRDSGTLRGKRITQGGRRGIKKSLFMACLSVIRYNDKLRPFFQRLVTAGKSKMTAIVATMRKLIVILNSMLKNDTCWNASIA